MKFAAASYELGWELRSVNPKAEIGPPCNDSRKISPGEVFWGLEGARDGGEFAADALKRGAQAVIVNRKWADILPPGSPMVVVGDTQVALNAFAGNIRQKFRGKVLGLTGSCGKTTAKELIYQVLSRKHRVVRSFASYNNHIGVPFTLSKLNGDVDIAVVEMGANHRGEISTLCEIARPTAGIITNVGRAHLEGFRTLRGVAEAKGELFRGLIGDKIGFVNFDDAYVIGQSKVIPHRVGYGFGLPPQGQGFPRIYRAVEHPGGFSLFNREYRFPFPPFMMIHALSAAAIGLFWGVPTDDIIDAIAGFEGVPGRMARREIGGIVIYDDTYNSNPSSLQAALQFISTLDKKRKIAVLGEMREMGASEVEEHENAVKMLKDCGFHRWFTFGGAFEAVPDSNCYDDKAEIATKVAGFLREGDIVLFKGSRATGMETVLEEVVRVIG